MANDIKAGLPVLQLLCVEQVARNTVFVPLSGGRSPYALFNCAVTTALM